MYCFKPLASKLLQPIIGEYCVIGRHIALHMSGSEDTDPCLRFYRLMAECQDVAIRVLSTPDGRYLGTLEMVLKFPQPIEALSYEIRTELAQKKLDSIKAFLESRVPDGGGPSAPASIMQSTYQPSRATTSSSTTGSSGPAPNVRMALPMLSCPPLP